MKHRVAYALAAVVAASFVIRTALAWLRAVPALFPDEYIYSSIGRSIAESGRPLIRGGFANFPALLQPIVTAPAWLIGDVDTGFRVVQAIGALAMSLAAVPVFLIAKRLGLSSWVSLALGVFAVLVPDLLYASFISAEALAYPLVLVSVYAAVRALAQPSPRGQLLFVCTAGLTTLARVQFAALPIVFLLAAVVVGARERRLKDALREQMLPFTLFALAAVALLAAGPSRSVGIYRYLFGFHAGPFGILHWASLDAMTLAYAAGWIIVPGALLGLWLALARPRTTEELAFGAVTVLLAAALFFEAGLLQASLAAGREIQERYVFYAAPLLALSFALYAARGWPLRLPHLMLAAGLVLMSVRLPLSGYAGPVDLQRLADPLRRLLVVRQAGLAGRCLRGGRRGGPADDARCRARLETPTARYAGGPRSGPARDRRRLGRGRDLRRPEHGRSQESLLARRPLLGRPNATRQRDDAPVVQRRPRKHAAGTLLEPLDHAGRAPPRRCQVRLVPHRARPGGRRRLNERERGPARRAAARRHLRLDRPAPGCTHHWHEQDRHTVAAGPIRPPSPAAVCDRALLRRLAGQVRGDLRVAERFRPRVSGWVSLRLTASRIVGGATITFQFAEHARATVRVRPGQPQNVRVPLCAAKDARMTYRSKKLTLIGVRAVTVRATAPVFTPSRAACARG